MTVLELLLLQELARREQQQTLEALNRIPIEDRFWHCTNDSCAYSGMSHTAAYCRNPQPRICGCHWDRERLKQELRR